MSKRTITEPVEDLWCDQAPCELIAAGPCVFCRKDLCALHGATEVRYKNLDVLICNEDRLFPISKFLDGNEWVQRRFDEFNIAKLAIIKARDGEA